MTDDKKKGVKKSGKKSGKSQPKTKKQEELSEALFSGGRRANDSASGAGSHSSCA